MKKKYISLLFLLLIASASFGQHVPRGMNYQAVARNNSGDIISGKKIELKISLQNNGSAQAITYYSEIHKVETNSNGLFSILIGQGSNTQGDFDLIPWSQENIWLSTAIKSETDPTFIKLNSTKLMAVPYAYHSATADYQFGNYYPYVQTGNSNGNSIFAGSTPATSWLVVGNVGSNPPTEYLGTGDLKDLVFKTNAIERMRILGGTGNVGIKNNLTLNLDLSVTNDAIINRDLLVHRHTIVDSNFTVKKNVYLNTSGGVTTNYGPFTVTNGSPSIMKGSLRVDQITNLMNGLNVNNTTPTVLTGTLRVNGKTDLYSAFSVNSKASSAMTGILRVDSDVTFKQHLTLDNASFGSSSKSTGALVLAGGLGDGQNLNVGDSANFGGPVGFAGQVKITDARQCYTPDSGSLIVNGGVGIKRQISVRETAHFYDSLKVDGPVRMDGFSTRSGATSLLVNGITTLDSNLNVNRQMTIDGSSNVSGSQTDTSAYPLFIKGNEQGIAIKVKNNKIANNYMSFWDAAGTMQGRIEGYAPGEYYNSTEYDAMNKKIVLRLATLSIKEAVAVAKLAGAVLELTGALGSVTPCVGLGACATAPIPSMIAIATVKIIAFTLQTTEIGFKISDATTELNDFLSNSVSKTGVTYESGAGDYAEYLEMLDKNEVMFPGDVVGLINGKISRNTKFADRIMVLSKTPIVLGNTPEKGKEAGYRQVAFLGQVPVSVIGKVNAGDYILPSGKNDGTAISVSRSAIKPENIKEIIGVAWSSSSNYGFNKINVSVGLNVNDNTVLITQMENEVLSMKNRLAARNQELARLVPGFTASIGSLNKNDIRNQHINFVTPSQDDIIYNDITDEEINEAVNYVFTKIKDLDANFEKTIIYKKYSSDSTYKTDLIKKIRTQLQEDIANRKALDHQLSK